MLQVGDKVPDFTLRLAYADGRRAPVAFSSLLGRGPVVLAFYPLAFTSVCTQEVCDMRDSEAALGALDATVAGFSIDSAPTNVAYARAHGLGYGLFSDPNREVVHRLWETQRVVGVNDCAKRGWLVADPDGVVRDLWITDDPEQWTGAAPIEAAVRRLTA